MKLTSKAVYKLLRAAIAPRLPAGFVAAPGNVAAWQQESAAGVLAFWCQCDKWGWDARWGSRFTLEFLFAADADAAQRLSGRRERIGELLEGFPELDELRQRNNAVIARLPGTLGDACVVTVTDEGEEIVLEGYRADPQPAVYAQDIWLHYYTADDVAAWGEYLAPRLPRFLECFAQQTRSAAGLAHRRFDAVLGRVQDCREYPGKLALLDDYLASESDPYYRASASRMRDALLQVLKPGGG
jgi:hypothetical protein